MEKTMEKKLSKKEIGLNYRRKYRGLVGVKSKLPVKDSAALSSVYTPGVGEVCLEIGDNVDKSYELTCRSNTIAIISDGSFFPGLGNVGAEGILPLLENKSILHKTLTGIDAYPIPVNTTEIPDIVRLVSLIKDSFGAYCFENISIPKCFELEVECKKTLNLPFLCINRDGSGVALLAALVNSTKLLNKQIQNLKVVISDIDVAGVQTARLLSKAQVKNVIACDKNGAIYEGRSGDMPEYKKELAQLTNPEKIKGSLEEVIKNADVFINFSALKEISSQLISSMASDPIIFSIANPGEEISYNKTIKAGAAIVATSAPDRLNHINVSIPTTGIFRGVLDVRAKEITDEMLIAAAYAITELVEEDELSHEYIMPKALDFRVAPKIAGAVASAAINAGIASIEADPQEIEQRTMDFVYEGTNAIFDPPTKSELDDKTPIGDKSILMHKRHKGVIEIKSKVPMKDNYIYKLLYDDSAALEPCKQIKESKDKAYDYTCKSNMIAVVTNGTAVLGLGDIGSMAGLPVMEGKCVLFKMLGGVEAIPICVNSKDIDEIVWVTNQISPVLGGVNLEDITAPSCFEIEEKLKQQSDILIFHDDQHGTAVVTLAGIINALKITKKDKEKVRVVMNGAGAGALAVTDLLLSYGIKNIVICDTKGAIYKGRPVGMNKYKDQMADLTNFDNVQGSLSDVLKGSDVFIGLSVGNVLSKEMVKSMNKDPIIFALANPYPEIMPNDAYEAGAKIVATGRSDFPNQVNNSIAFPGIFRGALDVRAKEISKEMKLAAAIALAGLIKPENMTKNNILPSGLDLRAPIAVSEAVAKTAIETGIARLEVNPEKIKRNLQEHLNEYVELRSVE